MKKQRVLVNILGYGIDSFTFDEAVDYACKHSGHIVTINPEMINNARSNKAFSDIISNADLVVPDGIGVEMGLRLLGHNIKRIPGIELGRKLLMRFSQDGKSVALLGAKPEVIQKTVARLNAEIDNINIVYSHDGYFSDDVKIIEQITASNPDLVLVALGSPKQELFIHELKEKLPNALMIGLGGSFDVWSGNVKRAPKLFQRFGLEWLYRLIKEPSRFNRIFPSLPVFVLNVCKERLLNK